METLWGASIGVNQFGLPVLGHGTVWIFGPAARIRKSVTVLNQRHHHRQLRNYGRQETSDNYAIMSDMGSERITVRIPQELGSRLRHRSRVKGQTESDLVREALEIHLGRSNGERSAFELAEEAGLIGAVRRGRRSSARSPAKDLSTNPRHFEGFGEDK